ncbi:MAG TPA: CoA pyrophosphatase [Nevskiaceae bacterium]|nr:CoA pyrophosphatase [Nevskiaceae bacterium]
MQLEQRLRRALAGTHEAPPRPIISLELPMKLDRFVAPVLMKSLRPAAVLAPVIRRGDALTMLFTRRSDQMRSHRGQISFPGGRRDDEDTSFASAALREAHEEIGLSPDSVEILGYLDDYPTITRYLVTPVVGIVGQAPTFTPHAREVAEVFEVPLDYVLDAGRYERKAFSRGGVNVQFFELNYGSYRIWGATAGMLWNLVEKVQKA